MRPLPVPWWHHPALEPTSPLPAGYLRDKVSLGLHHLVQSTPPRLRIIGRLLSQVACQASPLFTPIPVFRSLEMLQRHLAVTAIRHLARCLRQMSSMKNQLVCLKPFPSLRQPHQVAVAIRRQAQATFACKVTMSRDNFGNRCPIPSLRERPQPLIT